MALCLGVGLYLKTESQIAFINGTSGETSNFSHPVQKTRRPSASENANVSVVFLHLNKHMKHVLYAFLLIKSKMYKTENTEKYFNVVRCVWAIYCVINFLTFLIVGMIGRLSGEKHVERHIRGRRLSSLRPVVYRSTTNCDQPVQLTGDWRVPDYCECLHRHNVYELEVSSIVRCF